MQTRLLNRLMNDAAFEAVKRSALWQDLNSNAECDQAAEELSQILIAKAGEWTAERAGKLAAEKEQLAEVMA